jgi:hypothetical protein
MVARPTTQRQQGQQAISYAILYPEPEKGGRGKKRL